MKVWWILLLFAITIELNNKLCHAKGDLSENSNQSKGDRSGKSGESKGDRSKNSDESKGGRSKNSSESKEGIGGKTKLATMSSEIKIYLSLI